jgi:monomeric sarcosine oxidase
MGAATAWALSQRGHNVVVLEQFELAHNRGSSHGRARIFRLFYDDVRYVRKALEALPLWRELEQEVGETLFNATGGLDLGREAEGHAEAMSSCGVAFERLDQSEASKRFPNIACPDTTILFDDHAGTIDAERSIVGFAKAATNAGANVLENSSVTSIRDQGQRVELDVSGQKMTFDIAVVTAGAWAKNLLAEARIDLPVTATRETVGFFELEDASSYPIVVEFGEPSFYALPSLNNELKVGEHQTGPMTDPNDVGKVSEESVARVTESVRRRFPNVKRLHRAETCLYTNAPNDEFILERHGRIVVGSPCSGHGFKFAPAIGRRLADLAEQVD